MLTGPSGLIGASNVGQVSSVSFRHVHQLGPGQESARAELGDEVAHPCFSHGNACKVSNRPHLAPAAMPKP